MMSSNFLRFASALGRGGLALLLSQCVFSGAALAQIQLTTFGAIQAEPDAIEIFIDDALPNSVPVNTQPIGPATPTAFTDNGIGLVTTGQVGDWTSSQVTSDLYLNGTTTGPRGETISSDMEWTFVNPNAPSFSATVEKVGFYFGDTNNLTLRIELFDQNDVLLGGANIPATTPGTPTSNFGIEISPGETRRIGRVRFFSLIPGDLYAIGSYTFDPLTTPDIVISGFVAEQPVPLPATMALMMAGLLVLSRQKSKYGRTALSNRFKV